MRGLSTGWGSQSPSHRPTAPITAVRDPRGVAASTSRCFPTWIQGGWEDECAMVPMRPGQDGLHLAMPQDTVGYMPDPNCPCASVQAPTEGEGGSGCGMEVDRGWWDRGPISGGRGDSGRRAVWELKLQSLACAPLSRGLNNTSSRAKLLRISRWQPQSIRPQVRALLKVGPVWTHSSQAHEADTESKPEKSVESGNNFFWTNQLEQMGGPKREDEKS